MSGFEEKAPEFFATLVGLDPRAVKFWDRQKRDRAIGGTSIMVQLRETENRHSGFDDEELDWQRWAFCCAAGQVEREVEPATWRAFVMAAVDGLPPATIAAQLGIKTGSVYAAKCRVLARIRERVRELSEARI